MGRSLYNMDHTGPNAIKLEWKSWPGKFFIKKVSKADTC